MTLTSLPTTNSPGKGSPGGRGPRRRRWTQALLLSLVVAMVGGLGLLWVLSETQGDRARAQAVHFENQVARLTDDLEKQAAEAAKLDKALRLAQARLDAA